MAEAQVLIFRSREDLAEDEDFTLEIEFQPGLGVTVADQLRQILRGAAKVADFPDFPFERILDLAEKRNVKM